MKPSLVIAAVACGAVIGAAVAVVISGQMGDGEHGASTELVGAARPVELVGGGELGALIADDEASSSVEYRLTGGSTLHLEPGAHLETEENTGRVVVFNLRRGRATFDIAPLRHELFRVRASEVDVDVIGTRFTVEHGEHEVIIEVERGLVVVGGEPVSGERRLSPGQRLVVNLETPSMQGVAAGQELPVPSDTTPETELRSEESSARPRWHALARERSFDEAYELLGAGGLARETERAVTPDQLFALADVARLSGHPRDAISPLERLVASFPTDRRAALAAFTLGRIHLDTLGEPELAGRAFARSLQLGPPPSLREDARARIVEAHARAGDRIGARRAAMEYLELYPSGRHAARVRSLAGVDSR
jgi:transmembrane sensor